MKTKLIIFITCISFLLIMSFLLGYSLKNQKSYTNLSRKELATKTRTMGKQIEDQYPEVAGILYSLSGAILLQDELTLLRIVVEYSKEIIDQYNSKDADGDMIYEMETHKLYDCHPYCGLDMYWPDFITEVLKRNVFKLRIQA